MSSTHKFYWNNSYNRHTCNLSVYHLSNCFLYFIIDFFFIPFFYIWMLTASPRVWRHHRLQIRITDLTNLIILIKKIFLLVYICGTNFIDLWNLHCNIILYIFIFIENLLEFRFNAIPSYCPLTFISDKILFFNLNSFCKTIYSELLQRQWTRIRPLYMNVSFGRTLYSIHNKFIVSVTNQQS